MVNVNIPPGYGIPLVNLTTDLLPGPTMTALDARYPQVVRLTQPEYDALSTAEKEDPAFIYVIPE